VYIFSEINKTQVPNSKIQAPRGKKKIMVLKVLKGMALEFESWNLGLGI
jgi:hypothetical protein